jgi:hypothetical protein
MAGADQPQGEGWWQASDGKWYPPEQRLSTPPPAAPSPSPSPSPPSPAAPGGTGGSDEGFFARLFDTSFSTFVTPSIVKVLFILGVVVISIVSLFMLIGGLGTIDDGGLVIALIAPLYWLLGVIWVRVLIEVVMVLFRIEANTRRSDD